MKPIVLSIREEIYTSYEQGEAAILAAFDNNLAERDIRMVKVQQENSWWFSLYQQREHLLSGQKLYFNRP